MDADVDDPAHPEVCLGVLHARDGVHDGVVEDALGHVADHRVIPQEQGYLALPERHSAVQHVDRQVPDVGLGGVEEFLQITGAGARANGPVEGDSHEPLLRMQAVPLGQRDGREWSHRSATEVAQSCGS